VVPTTSILHPEWLTAPVGTAIRVSRVTSGGGLTHCLAVLVDSLALLAISRVLSRIAATRIVRRVTLILASPVIVLLILWGRAL